MRIIRGTHRGRKINAPANLPVRPTTDMAKESLFNILDNHVYFEDRLVDGADPVSFKSKSTIYGVDDKNVYLKSIIINADPKTFRPDMPIDCGAGCELFLPWHED